jgi:hypothetical protein
VIWVVTALVLLAWLAGVILSVGGWINLLLVVAAIVLLSAAIGERTLRDE